MANKEHIAKAGFGSMPTEDFSLRRSDLVNTQTPHLTVINI